MNLLTAAASLSPPSFSGSIGACTCAGADLKQHNSLQMAYAGFHYDLNFLTIHGKSRFPGLFVWLRDGRRVPVQMPEGCLLLQAGKQMEWLTGGHVQAGMHEVSQGQHLPATPLLLRSRHNGLEQDNSACYACSALSALRCSYIVEPVVL